LVQVHGRAKLNTGHRIGRGSHPYWEEA
jgi:hypothetical protein